MNYVPALDGIRAIAVFAVMAFHARAPGVEGGFLGVDVFFVLSAFLITSILKHELKAFGAISVGRFYLRRALRLFPTLLLVLMAVMAAAPVLWPERDLLSEAILSGLYLSDYSRAFWGTPRVLSHTWSLSVEAHFYLVWPLALPWLLRCRDPARLMLRVYATLTIWRGVSVLWLGWDPTYYRFDTRASGLALGCWLALAQIGAPRPSIGWVSMAAFAGLCAFSVFGSFNGIVTHVMLVEASAVGLILAAASGTGPAAILSRPALAYVGRISYGLYLWHYPIFFWMRDRADWMTTLLAGGLLSVALAMLSHHLVDLPARRARADPSGARATRWVTKESSREGREER